VRVGDHDPVLICHPVVSLGPSRTLALPSPPAVDRP
jgi:hypothetical protein